MYWLYNIKFHIYLSYICTKLNACNFSNKCIHQIKIWREWIEMTVWVPIKHYVINFSSPSNRKQRTRWHGIYAYIIYEGTVSRDNAQIVEIQIRKASLARYGSVWLVVMNVPVTFQQPCKCSQSKGIAGSLHLRRENPWCTHLALIRTLLYQ